MGFNSGFKGLIDCGVTRTFVVVHSRAHLTECYYCC